MSVGTERCQPFGYTVIWGACWPHRCETGWESCQQPFSKCSLSESRGTSGRAGKCQDASSRSERHRWWDSSHGHCRSQSRRPEGTGWEITASQAGQQLQFPVVLTPADTSMCSWCRGRCGHGRVGWLCCALHGSLQQLSPAQPCPSTKHSSALRRGWAVVSPH